MPLRIDDGFPTKFAFSLDPSAEFWEKTVKPPGMDAGGENDTTTMHNIRWRTKKPKKLINLTPITGQAAYASHVMVSILDMLGKNQLITITYPDLSTYAIWGWIDKFEPGENTTAGEQPTAAFTIVPSNLNDSDVETDPVYTPAP